MGKYEVVIGLEIHAELSTTTKAFCFCEYKYGAEENTQCCPGCMGMPGTLPVLNKNVVEYALKMGIATDCRINKLSKFDRKNYFYPDLAKGYQITQSDIPICQDGSLEFIHKGEISKVRLSRIHIEEDTAKLLHENAESTLIDFNRSGVPLIEIVTEPDLRSAREVEDFLEGVRMLLAALDICNCKMQEGAIRCDVNVSVRPEGQKEYGTRVEMKNVNTFSGAKKAVEYEADRQIRLIESGLAVTQETRRWDEHKNETMPMRSKENAIDYRYFPESDLVPLEVSDEWIEKTRKTIPELPTAKYKRYRGIGIPEAACLMLIENARPELLIAKREKYRAMDIPETMCWDLIKNAEKAAYFEQCAENGGVSLKMAANWIINVVSFEKPLASAKDFCRILNMVEQGIISDGSGKTVLEETVRSGESPDETVKRLSLEQVSDTDELKKIVQSMLDANMKAVSDYKNGQYEKAKDDVLNSFVGQYMKVSKGKGNARDFKAILKEALNSLI